MKTLFLSLGLLLLLSIPTESFSQVAQDDLVMGLNAHNSNGTAEAETWTEALARSAAIVESTFSQLFSREFWYKKLGLFQEPTLPREAIQTPQTRYRN